MKKYIILAICTVFASNALAQNDVLLTQQWFSRINNNPAAVGSTNDIDIAVIHRNQWSGFDGAPSTTMLNAHNFFDKFNSGVGISVAYDKEGDIQSTWNAKALYSYYLKLDAKSTLSLGLGVGVQNRTIDYSKAQLIDPNDPAIPLGKESKTNIDFDFGAEYTYDRFTAGASVTHIGRSNNNKLDNFKNTQQIYFYARYRAYVTKDFDLAPMFTFAYGNKKNVWEIGAIAYLYKNFWLGATWRNQVAVCFMGGVQWNMFRLGYSYDSYTGDVNSLASGTHEIMLNVRIAKKGERRARVMPMD